MEMKELNLNETEQVNGGFLISVLMIAAGGLSILGGAVFVNEMKD